MRDDGRRRPSDPTRLRANQRERALGRLSRLTTATAVAGTFATVGFGGLAAVTYSGKTTTPSDPTGVSSATGQDSSSSDASTQQVDPNAPQANGTNGTTTDPQTTTGSTTTNRPIIVAQPPTRTRTHSHVVSGGSGG